MTSTTIILHFTTSKCNIPGIIMSVPHLQNAFIDYLPGLKSDRGIYQNASKVYN